MSGGLPPNKDVVVPRPSHFIGAAPPAIYTFVPSSVKTGLPQPGKDVEVTSVSVLDTSRFTVYIFLSCVTHTMNGVK